MIVWRICRAPYQALDGEGARLWGGRWNSEGVPVVYCASTLALAALEYLVHVDPDHVPADLVAMRIHVPDDLPAERVDPSSLPDGWNRLTEHVACMAAGDEWIARGRSPLLRVPSAIVPEEENVLLDSRHPAAEHVRVDAVRGFAFDPRLLD